MSIKVATISTACTGGAGSAAYRLHSAFLARQDIDSSFIQADKYQANASLDNTYSIFQKYSLIDKIRGRLRIDQDSLNNNYLKNTLRSNYEMVSFPFSNYQIENSLLVRNAHIVNLHWVSEFLNYSSFFKKVKQPVIWTLHDMNPFMGIFHYEGDRTANLSNLGNLDREIYLKKLKLIHRKKNIHIVCLSDWMKQKSEKSEILGKYQHHLIPNGLDFNNYPLLAKDDSKKKIKVNNGQKTILFIAHDLSVYRKGFDLVVNAIKGMGSVKFNLVSVGGDKINVNEGINHIHYNRIYNSAELNVLYSAADITIIPSREDNLPNVMLESFANGTPVLSFSNGGMTEHISTGHNGILVDTIGVDLLKLELKKFLEGQYLFQSETIREYALNKFSNIIQSEKYVELYKSILGQ